ncbi:AI-2E family transporter [Thiosocius teredinicola]|uniref:AI-2E family transporter n=1 Tax=Thiosocius teredinicola TaxID=1973002 RepID=UPI000990B473
MATEASEVFDDQELGQDDETVVRRVGESRSLRYLVSGMFMLALMAALYFGRPVFLPLATAFLLSFILRPVVRKLCEVGVPAPLTALLLVCAFAGSLTFVGVNLKDPAMQWLEEAPESLQQLHTRILLLKEPIAEVQEATEKLSNLGSDVTARTTEIVVSNGGIEDQIIAEATNAAIAAFTTMVFLFFILGWGDRLFRNVINALPNFHEQRKAVIVSREVENSIALYLFTITLINMGLGIVVAFAMYLMDMPNPILWGVMAGVLNYIPYLGTVITATVLGFVALLTFPTVGEAMLIPLVFFLITTIEGYVVTPFALGNQLTLNPLLIFLSLVLWYWMWGVIGALLTVPILVVTKVILERMESGSHLARILD